MIGISIGVGITITITISIPFQKSYLFVYFSPVVKWWL